MRTPSLLLAFTLVLAANASADVFHQHSMYGGLGKRIWHHDSNSGQPLDTYGDQAGFEGDSDNPDSDDGILYDLRGYGQIKSATLSVQLSSYRPDAMFVPDRAYVRLNGSLQNIHLLISPATHSGSDK